MKYKLTLALVAALTSTAFAAFQAPLPEFKNEKKLAEWRAEKASESTNQGYASEETAFYTGKPYLASSGGYAFRYRAYNSEFARWTSEDPSGFPDGANLNIYVSNSPNCWLDSNGLSGTLVINSTSNGNSSLSTSGHSWISYTPDGGATSTYGTWGNNPTGTGNGLFANLEQTFNADVSRSTHLNDQQEQQLQNAINSYSGQGAGGWTHLNPCSGFASEAWRTATGETLSDGWPVSTPTTLKESIRSANGGTNHGIVE
jgi:RHS repeat-associated protein